VDRRYDVKMEEDEKKLVHKVVDDCPLKMKMMRSRSWVGGGLSKVDKEYVQNIHLVSFQVYEEYLADRKFDVVSEEEDDKIKEFADVDRNIY